MAQKTKNHTEETRVLLHDLNEQILRWWEQAGWPPRPGPLALAHWKVEFSSMATCSGLWGFLDGHLANSGPLALPPGGFPLLCYALDLDIPQKMLPKQVVICPSVVETLLRHGSDPNEALGPPTYTVWHSFLHKVVRSRISTADDIHYLVKYAEILRLMLQYNADVTPCYRGWRHGARFADRPLATLLSIESVIEEVFAPYLPQEASALRASLEKRKQNSTGKRKSEGPEHVIPGKLQRNGPLDKPQAVQIQETPLPHHEENNIEDAYISMIGRLYS